MYADRRLAGIAYVGVLVGGAAGSASGLARTDPGPAGRPRASDGGGDLGRARRTIAGARGGDRRPPARSRRPAGRPASRSPTSSAATRAGLDADELARACVESVAENTSDAVVAPLLWGAIAGLPGLLGLSRGEHPGRHGRPPLAALSTVRLGGGAARRRPQLGPGTRSPALLAVAPRRRIAAVPSRAVDPRRGGAPQPERGRGRGRVRRRARAPAGRDQPVRRTGRGPRPTRRRPTAAAADIARTVSLARRVGLALDARHRPPAAARIGLQPSPPLGLAGVAESAGPRTRGSTAA